VLEIVDIVSSMHHANNPEQDKSNPLHLVPNIRLVTGRQDKRLLPFEQMGVSVRDLQRVAAGGQILLSLVRRYTSEEFFEFTGYGCTLPYYKTL